MIVSAASHPTVDLASLRSQFTRLAVDLSRTDAELEGHQRESRYPTRGWDELMFEYGARIDGARMQFAQVRPDAQDLIHALGADARHAATLGGKLDIMQDHRLTFARGWGTTLDRTIGDVQRAADLLDMAPVPPAPPVPPTPPTGPGRPPSAGVVADAGRAADLVRQSIDTIRTVPASDRGDASTKDARIAAYNLNMQAQQVLEPYFTGSNADPTVLSDLRRADAHLEDANWQLAKKPSPDGRFNGVDIPGALRDSEAAAQLLEHLAQPTA